MNPDELKHTVNHWIEQHFPHIDIPDGTAPLGCDKLLNYYEHMEIAMLALKLHDTYPDYLLMIRKRRNYVRRLQGVEFKKEQFRSMTAF